MIMILRLKNLNYTGNGKLQIKSIAALNCTSILTWKSETNNSSNVNDRRSMILPTLTIDNRGGRVKGEGVKSQMRISVPL